MRTKLHTGVFLSSLFCCITALSQVTINFNAPVYGQSLEGLSFVQVTNSSGEDVRVTITARVRENTAGNVVTAIFVGVPLRRGVNTIDGPSFSRGRFSFGNNYPGLTLSQTGRFPEGEYEYCFEAEITDSKTPWPVPFFENCFIQQLQPLTPLILINPPDEDESCNTRPSFLWQLPFPLPADARCRLVLTELRDKQDIAEAINYNMPLINQGNILGNQLLFPAQVPALKEGKKYVWQVVVYTGQTVLKRSEIWIYEVKCEPEKQDPVTDSYRELKETDDGNFYIAGKFLRFSFNNPYSAGVLNYSITSLTDPSFVIKDLPVLTMQPGLNKYDIDISDNKAFKKGQEYILKVMLTGNRQFRLRFLYTNE
jgi:hypothetical protein